MPPPYLNPISRNRYQFTGEPMPSVLDEPQVGYGRTGLSSYISPTLAANSALELDRYNLDRSNAETAMRQNYIRQKEMAMRSRLLPSLEAADMAAATLREAESRASLGNVQPRAQMELEQARLATQRAQAEQHILPDKTRLEMLQTKDAADNWQPVDPYQQRLMRITKDPAHLLAYEDMVSMNSKLPPRQRQEMAFQAATALAQDQPAVEAIEATLDNAKTPEEYAAKRSKLIEDIKSPSGRYIGSRIKPDADIGEVNRILRQHQNWKQRAALEKADAETNKTKIRLLGDEQDDINARRRTVEARLQKGDYPSGSNQAKADLDELTSLNDRMKEVARLRGELLGLDKPTVSNQKSPVAETPALSSRAETPQNQSQQPSSSPAQAKNTPAEPTSEKKPAVDPRKAPWLGATKFQR